MTTELGVVSEEMFDRCADPLALHSADIADCHPGSQKRVFSEVFEVSAIEGCAIDVHAGAKHEVLSLRSCVTSNPGADLSGQGLVPRGRKSDASGHHGCGAVVANTKRTVCGMQLRQSQPLDAADIKKIDAGQHIDLL